MLSPLYASPVTRHPSPVTLAVSDTGPGIASEHLPHIFEQFYRAEGSSSAQWNGTGLGLSIVQSIARAHGGEVLAESEVGRGTRIEVRLSSVTGSA